MNTRVAWILLFTYIVQLVLGGFGLWVVVQFSQRDAPSRPPPPTTTTAPPTTTLPLSQRFGNQRWNNYHESDEPSKEYREYVVATTLYADYIQNPRMYIMVPCGVAVMIAAGLVVGGICSRKTFTKTTGFYSSLGLWIVILLTAILYQSVDWKPDSDFYSTLEWVIGMQVGLLLLLALQIALAVWELRRQKTCWPCINFTHLFTVETILLVTRFTLGMCLIANWNFSSIITGLREGNSWEAPRLRYPEYFALPCIIAALYGVIVSGEGICSQLLGKVHNRLMTFTSFVSAICYAALAVLASPVFVRAVIGPYRVRQEVMNFAIVSSIVSFVHAIACLVFPSGVRAPPHFIRTIADHMSKEFSMNEFSIKEAVSSSSAAMSSAALMLRSKFRGSNALYSNILSSVLSVLAIILLGIGSGSYGGTRWPGILMLCGDVALFFRSLPEALSELVYHHCHETNLLKIVHLSLENIILFIASLGAFSNGWPPIQVICGVINILIVIVQTGRVMQYYMLHNKGMSTVGETGGEEDTKPLKEAELETAQELSDEEHSGPPEIFA